MRSRFRPVGLALASALASMRQFGFTEAYLVRAILSGYASTCNRYIRVTPQSRRQLRRLRLTIDRKPAASWLRGLVLRKGMADGNRRHLSNLWFALSNRLRDWSPVRPQLPQVQRVLNRRTYGGLH